MALPESPTKMAFQVKINHFTWLLEELNWTSVKDVFCPSSSEMMAIWIIFSIELLVMCLALYGLCSMLRSDHTVPIFVINLFFCDIVQICVKPFLHLCTLNTLVFFIFHIYIMSIMANVGFMVCISMERYIMIKYPVWYRLHNDCRKLVLMCLAVWVVLLGLSLINLSLGLKGRMEHAFFLGVVLFLMPYPLVVFFFVGSWRALSNSVAVTANERKRILCILALVLFNYTVLFLPNTVQNALFFTHGISGYYKDLHSVSGIMLYLNPLADSLLYFFLRKDANSILKCLCCKKPQENQA